MKQKQQQQQQQKRREEEKKHHNSFFGYYIHIQNSVDRHVVIRVTSKRNYGILFSYRKI